MPNEEVNISELCRLIRDSVGDAVTKAAHSSEVQEIKDAVRSVVREVADELGATARTTGETVRDSVKRSTESVASSAKKASSYTYVYKTPEPTPEVSGPPVWKGSTQSMMVKGGLMSFFGVVGTIGALGLAALVGSIALNVIADITTAVAFGLFSLIPIGAAIAFIALATRGTRLRGMAARYKKYIAAIGNDSFCALTILGEKAGKGLRYVQKDIKRMIKAGMFPEGQLDRDKTTLILDTETYQHYLETQQKAAEQKTAQPEPQADGSETTEVDKALAEGKEYIRRMRLANDLIDGQEMSAKIDRLERVGLRIFDHVEQNPNKLSDIRRFMSYYLPITLKLLESYAKFDNQPVQGENITTAKREIEETLDTITVAFENLLDNMFGAEAMDISSDISALSAMLAQEGLTGSDFKTAADQMNDKI